MWNICRLVNKSVNYRTRQKVPRPKSISFGLEYEKVQKVDFVDYVRNEAMLVLVFTVFQ